MTTIQKLTAKGFKSFAHKTELIFGEGFNCVLGPNGAGKSNVVDAICFVLGKSSARELRAEKSANLIFNGGKIGSPAKEAEVEIVFDNTKKEFQLETQQVRLKRIVNKNGVSKYVLNDEVYTRQQIVDVLYQARIDPDGHNIVLQGDIVHFMEMRTQERRELIEEISGISIYEEKKHKCLLELDKVGTRLHEAQIILTEREANLRELKRDRDQALQYQQLEKDLQDFKATQINYQINEKKEKVQETEKKLTEQQERIEHVQQKIDEIKKQILELRTQISELTKEIEQKGEKEQLALRREIEEIRTTVIKLQSRSEVLEQELERIKVRKVQLEQDKKQLQQKITETEKQKEELLRIHQQAQKIQDEAKKRITEIKKETGFEGTYAAETFEKIEKQLDKGQNSIESKKEELQEIFRKKDQYFYQVHTIQEKIKNLKGTGSAQEVQKLKEKRKELEYTTKELEKLKADDQSLVSQYIRIKERLSSAEEQLAKISTQKAIQQERTATDLATKKMLELKKEISGIYGTVAQLGQVDKEYSLALEVAAGPRLQSVVVETDHVAQQCIEYLKLHQLGVVTFLPLNQLKERPIPDEVKEILKTNKIKGLALDLVEYEPKFKKVFSYVFGATVIVTDIAQARRVGMGLTRMVTLEGDLLEVSGAMIGGFRHKTWRATGFMQKGLRREEEIAQEEYQKAQNLFTQIQKTREKNDEEIQNVRKQRAELDAEIITLQKTLNVEGVDLGTIEKEEETLIKELETQEQKIKQKQESIVQDAKIMDELKLQKQKIKEKLNNPQIIRALEQKEQERSKAQEEIIKAEAQIKSLQAQVKNLLEPELEKIQQIFKQQEKEDQSFKEELAQIKEKLKEQQKIFEQKEKYEAQFFTNIRELINKRNTKQEKVQEKEGDIIRHEEAMHGIEQKMNLLAIDRAKLVAEAEGLQKELEQYPQAQVRDIVFAELRDKIYDCEKAKSKIGNVNLRALEVYEDLAKEYEQLVEKAAKLNQEKEDVLNMITEIEKNKKDLFMKTYTVLANNFHRIFSELNHKAEASFVLENQEDPLSEGVDIEVKLAKNKIMDIKSLSGGEKTLAALSFIFAIQEYAPSGFYLFDEIDAALDKKNSEVLSQLIRKYASEAQYLVISHNDTVITEADQIYGVSMQDGVSKVVSLKV